MFRVNGEGISNGHVNALRRQFQAQAAFMVRTFQQKGRDKARRIQVSWEFLTGFRKRRMAREEAELIEAVKFFHGLKGE